MSQIDPTDLDLLVQAVGCRGDNSHGGEVAGVEIRNDENGGSLVGVLLRNQGEELYAYNPAGTLRTVAGIRTESKLLCLRRENGQAYGELAETK